MGPFPPGTQLASKGQTQGILMIGELFLRHPRAVGESYLEHQRVAFGFARELMVAGMACGVHAVVPALFTRSF